MLPPHRAKICLLVVSIAMFMDSMDTTILNTAIPTIAQDLHIHPIELKIALISYLMSLAIFIPISGWICDKFGIKKTFLTAIGLFSLASLGCGFVGNIYQLIILRFIQGIGGALNVPVARIIILKSFPKKEFLPKMNTVVMIASIASMLGPVVGGVIVEYFNWSWIFWVNVPIGLINFILIRKYLHEIPPQKNLHALDKIGFVLFGVGLSLTMLSLSMLSNIEIQLHVAFEILLISLILFLSYFIHSKKKKNPIIDVGLFKQKNFTLSILGGIFSRICFGGLPFLLPLFFQIQLGKSAIHSGLLIFFLPLGSFFSRSISIDILTRFGFKRTLIYNSLLLAFIVFDFANITPHTPTWQILTPLFLLGVCLTNQFASLTTLCFEEIADSQVGASSSIFSTMLQFGISLGIANSALLLRFYSVNEVFTPYTFINSFLTLSLFPIALIILFLNLNNNAGNSMIGKKNETEH